MKNTLIRRKGNDRWVEANHQRLVLEKKVEILTFYLELIERGSNFNNIPFSFKELQNIAKEALEKGEK